MDEVKPTTMVHLCSQRGHDYLICGETCSATLCSEVVPEYISKSQKQILQFIRVKLAKEDYYVKGNKCQT